MNILVSNDDGYDAPGIQTLISRLERDGHNIMVVAPETQQSAKSHSLTLHDTLYCYKVEENRYKVSGTPADCVLLAEKRLLTDQKIDLVISGINKGQNIGEDIYYSGTVAAAREATFHGYKAIAVSRLGFEGLDFDLPAEFVAQAIQNNVLDYIQEGEFLNINVPEITRDELEGVVVTLLGHREFTSFSKGKILDDGVIEFNFGVEEMIFQEDPGTDIEAVHNNKISITPIFANISNDCSIRELKKWKFLSEFK